MQTALTTAAPATLMMSSLPSSLTMCIALDAANAQTALPYHVKGNYSCHKHALGGTQFHLCCSCSSALHPAPLLLLPLPLHSCDQQCQQRATHSRAASKHTATKMLQLTLSRNWNQ